MSKKEEIEEEKEKEKKEETEEEQKGEASESSTGVPSIPAIETELYEILGVDPTATRAQIKKAYFLKARKCHPDKNPDNPEAEKEFKELAEAYEILSNDDLRYSYHKFGKEAVLQASGGFTNPKQLFGMLFGGGQFAHIIGELSFFGNEGEEMMNDEDFEKTHKERVASIKEHLEARLKPWMEGRVKAFMEELEKEAEQLRKESYGPEIFQHVGYIYDNEARKFLKGFMHIPGMVASFKEKVHYLSEVYEIVKQGVKVQMVEEALLIATEEERIELEPQIFKETVVAMWRIARLDMEAAVRDACEELLKDKEIDRPSRKRRAEGLKRIAKYWRSITAEPGKEGAWEFFAEMDSHMKAEAAQKWSMPSYSGNGRKLLTAEAHNFRNNNNSNNDNNNNNNNMHDGDILM